jgi:integrase
MNVPGVARAIGISTDFVPELSATFLLLPSRLLTVALTRVLAMASANITKRTVDAARKGARDRYLWDEKLTGFGLKVTPAGRKVYLFQYRVGGRTRRVTIGQHGPWTPTRARAKAKSLSGDVAAGRDPAASRDKSKADRSLGELFAQFMAEHVETKLRASTANGYKRLARLFVLPQLGRRKVGELQRADVAKVHHAMRETPFQANRTVALLGKFFTWTEKRGLRPDGSNPCRHVEKYREARRERFLSQAEMARLGDALRHVETEQRFSPWAIAAIRLLAFTGARRGEIISLRWEHVSQERACLMLPESKTGSKTILLNPPALAILQAIPRIEGNPYVICGERQGRHISNIEHPWQRIRALAGLDDVRLHDLRHSFASVGAAGNTSLIIIGKLLGHTQPQTTQRYSHLGDDPVRAASDTIGQRIAAAMAGGTGEVVDLEKSAQAKVTVGLTVPRG